VPGGSDPADQSGALATEGRAPDLVPSTLSMVDARMRARARSTPMLGPGVHTIPASAGPRFGPAAGRGPHAKPLERSDGKNAWETDIERFLEGPTDFGGPDGVYR
jgi:hypothetical protein